MTSAQPLSVGRAQALLHLTVLVWGLTAILGKLISLTALTLVLYRMGFATVLLAGWAMVRGISLRVPRGDALRLLLTGALVAAHWVCFYACIKVAGISVAVVCLSSGGLITALLNPLILKTPIRVSEVVFGVFAVVGVVLLVNEVPALTPAGLALGLASSLFSAVFGSINGRLTHRFDATVLSTWELATGGTLVLLLTLARGEAIPMPWQVAGSDWLWLTVLTVVCTVIPWLWSLRVLRTLRPISVMLAVNLEPVYSLVIAWLLFPQSERLSVTFYLGTLVLLAVVGAHSALRARNG